MATFLQLQDEVLNHGFNANTYRARVKDYLNIAQARIARTAEIRDLVTKASVVTVSGTQAYTLPTDFVRLQSLVDDPNNVQLSIASPKQFDKYPTVNGAPYLYALSEQGLLLYPTPDAVYTLTLRYWKDPVDLSADGDISALPIDYHDLMVSFALSRTYRSEDDIVMSQFFYSEFERDLAKLRADRMYEAQDGPRVVPGTWEAPIKEF